MDKEFDVVTWRKENPMDYQKAMDIINSCPSDLLKDIAHKYIYKITRLHIPETLYKFISFTEDETLNQSKLNVIKNKTLFMSDIENLNDPYDSKGYYYDHNKLKDITRLSPHNGKLIDDFSSFSKITCLTANNYISMPMWAHYANNHNGFCLSYDMKEKANISLRGCTFPVQYTDKRIDVTDFMKKQASTIEEKVNSDIKDGIKITMLSDLSMIYMIIFFSNIKNKSWSYEREFRCIAGKTAVGMPYMEAVPKEIYIGAKCNKENYNKLVELSECLDIPAYLTLMDELNDKFTLKLKKI